MQVLHSGCLLHNAEKVDFCHNPDKVDVCCDPDVPAARIAPRQQEDSLSCRYCRTSRSKIFMCRHLVCIGGGWSTVCNSRLEWVLIFRRGLNYNLAVVRV